MALEDLPEGAELWKIYVTGNLGVIIDGELIGVLDLVSGEFHDYGD